MPAVGACPRRCIDGVGATDAVTQKSAMSIAMGGDETGGIVGDIGSRCSKFGFGGTDTPTCVMGSALGCVFPEGAAYRRAGV